MVIPDDKEKILLDPGLLAGHTEVLLDLIEIVPGVKRDQTETRYFVRRDRTDVEPNILIGPLEIL